MLRRWLVWGGCGAVVALIAFAPFRDEKADSSGASTTGVVEPGPGGTTTSDGSIGVGSATGPSGTDRTGTDLSGGGTATGDGAGAASTPDGPRLSTPTPAQLAVLGPLIQAMDTGQGAGTPLVLGIATSLVASGLPADSQVPAELRPVVAALADLIATPGANVNDVTAQSSYYLAQLDRALGDLAFLNPTLNATIHQVADQLAVLGRSAAPSSPPGAQSLSDLSVLLTFFLVE